MSPNNRGFSLVELMVTMVVFVFVLVAGSQIFTALLTQFKQQSKIGETDIEGAVGLDLMRYDLAHAGYGLPWAIPGGGTLSTLSNYKEAATVGGGGPNPDPASFNDGASTTGPRAIVSGTSLFNNPAGNNGQSYLVIKSTVAATNYTAGKWTNLRMGAAPGTEVKTTWTPNINNVNAKDGNAANNSAGVRVIVLTAGSSRSLVLDGTDWFTTYGNTVAFAPQNSFATNVIYGIDPDTDLRMPFNRTDYYIAVPADLPNKCATGTGVLYKATVNQADGSLSALPLLDCVAYMHVDYALNTGTSAAPNYVIQDDISGLSAQNIRDQLQEVRVYIIAQEGQKDMSYDFTNNGARTAFHILPQESFETVSRGLYLPYDVTPGTSGDLGAIMGNADYKHYRWKLYTLVVQPNNLR
jgi:prepilin-type N-terminal cleavage/methylation domain-containing protein